MPAPESAPRVLRIAAAMLVRADGRTLLVRKRHTTTFMQPGCKIDAGETAPLALVRELKEERLNARGDAGKAASRKALAQKKKDQLSLAQYGDKLSREQTRS